MSNILLSALCYIFVGGIFSALFDKSWKERTLRIGFMGIFWVIYISIMGWIHI